VNRLFTSEDLLDFLDDLLGAAAARFRRPLNVDDNEALVLIRQERRRQLHERPSKPYQQRQIDDHEATGALDDPIDGRCVARRRAVEPAVEPAEEALLLVMLALGDRLQEGGAKRRGER